MEDVAEVVVLIKDQRSILRLAKAHPRATAQQPGAKEKGAREQWIM